MKIAVVGAGASGMMAAIIAAKNGAEVSCFDCNDKLGKKIYATGNGKCNFSNLALNSDSISSFYPESDVSFLADAFQIFSVKEICHFFKEQGLLTTHRSGYLYPYSGQASTIVHIFEELFATYRITFINSVRVKQITKRSNKSFILSFEAYDNAPKKLLRNHTVFDRVILATGGKAYPSLGSDGSGYTLATALGHHLITPRPALCGVVCKGDYWDRLAGVRASAHVTILDECGKPLTADTGELQLCRYGLSGIPIFNCSHFIGKQIATDKACQIVIDFIPAISEEEYLFPSASMSIYALLSRIVHEKIADVLLSIHSIKPTTPATKDLFVMLLEHLKHFCVTPTTLNSFDQAQVTCGGVPLSEIADSFSSKFCPGLYFCGELLDVDGICGGYNLQWAWTSGYIAGLHAACDIRVEEL